MKLSILAAAMVAVALTGTHALAQSQNAADKPSKTQPAVQSPAEFDKQLAQWREQMTQEQIRQRQYMMDQYMPMQQMMMDHMMWHQRWMTQPSAPATK